MAQWSKYYKDYLDQQRSNFEVVMLADQNGDLVGAANPSGPSADAFGRQRISAPFTLFDSSHRFSDNGLWNESTSGTAASSFNANQGLIEMTIGSDNGDELIRETKKVFSYQPGKSLLIMNTFVMDSGETGLRQRVGYFGENNGIFFELDGEELYLVERTFVSGSLVETRVAQENWNGDNLDGAGVSGITIDITKAQIFWMDVEWLGVGSVRAGFVINGKMILCHTFHHSNLIESTYITTASLPLRYEITNTAATTGSRTLKQICTTVISEGGYELRGKQFTASTSIATAYRLTTKGTFYPLVSLKLKTSPNRLDSVAVLSGLSFVGINNSSYSWRIVSGGTTTAGTWVSAGTDSSIQYNITGTSYSGGSVLASGFVSSTNQSASSTSLPKSEIFQYQLERNSFTSTPTEITLLATSSTDTVDVFGSLNWEEITR